MNNVWAAIIVRAAPCARSTASQQPWLQLLSNHTTCASNFPPFRNASSLVQRQLRSTAQTARLNQCSFTTSAASFTAKKRKSAKKPIAKVSKVSKPAPNKPTSVQPTTVQPANPLSASEPSERPVRTLTWRDYDPEGGMPIRGQDLSLQQIHDILGPDVDAETGNYILNVLNWRRQSGALIDSGIDFPKWGNGVTRQQALLGLEYVRSLDPGFDETAAGQLWVEEETARARLEIQARSIKLGIYKLPEGQTESDEIEVAEEEPEALQGTEYGRQKYGESALVEQRKRREREWEEEQAKKAQETKQEELAAIRRQRGPLQLGGGVQPKAELVKMDPKDVALNEQRARSKAWQEKWEQKATISKGFEVPQMSIVARLGPAFVVLVATLALSWAFYNVYTPPPASARMFPDIPPSIATVGAVTLVLLGCALVGKIPPFWPFYTRYMSIVPAYPYAASIVGAVFRHDRLSHLASNLMLLWLVGPILHEDVGRGGFLAIFLSSAAVGGFATLSVQVWRKAWSSYVFGASNAILGLFAAMCTIHPQRTVHAFGYDWPVAVWLFLALNLTAETVGLMAGYGAALGVDFVGHIAGQLTGFGIAMALRNREARSTAETVIEPPENDARERGDSFGSSPSLALPTADAMIQPQDKHQRVGTSRTSPLLAHPTADAVMQPREKHGRAATSGASLSPAAILQPSLQAGLACGAAGFVFGGFSGIIKGTTPFLFATASGIQTFTLGTAFWATRTILLNAWNTGDETASDRLKASVLAGGLSGGAVALITRGRKNVLPATIMWSILGGLGQMGIHRLTAPRSEEPKENFWKRIARKTWSPVTVLSDEEYVKVLNDRVLKLDVEISLLDDKIDALKRQRTEDEQGQPAITGALVPSATNESADDRP